MHVSIRLGPYIETVSSQKGTHDEVEKPFQIRECKDMQSVEIGSVLHPVHYGLQGASLAQEGGEEQGVHEWIAMNGLIWLLIHTYYQLQRIEYPWEAAQLMKKDSGSSSDSTKTH